MQEIEHPAIRGDEPFVIDQVAEDLFVVQELQWLFSQVSRTLS